jgi:hypothetical protein
LLCKNLPEAQARIVSRVEYSNMAASDVSSKLSNLNLGEDNNEMERPKYFWNRDLVAMKFNFEPTWLDATWKGEQKPNFGKRNLH